MLNLQVLRSVCKIRISGSQILGTTALISNLFELRAVNKLISMSKKIIFSVLFSFLFSMATVFTLSQPTLAQEDTSYGLNKTAQEVSAFKNQKVSDNFIQTKAGQVIGVLLSFVGVLFLILMIYAGLMWMTAQGNSQQVDKAKDLLINSVVGIIIVFSAYAITAFMGKFISDQLLK